MSTYSVVDEGTGEVMRQGITSVQLQGAEKLLQATKHRLQAHQDVQNAANSRDIAARVASHTRAPLGVVKTSTYNRQPKQQTIGQALDHLAQRLTPKLVKRQPELWRALEDGAGTIIALVCVLAVIAVLSQ